MKPALHKCALPQNPEGDIGELMEEQEVEGTVEKEEDERKVEVESS